MFVWQLLGLMIVFCDGCCKQTWVRAILSALLNSMPATALLERRRKTLLKAVAAGAYCAAKSACDGLDQVGFSSG